MKLHLSKFVISSNCYGTLLRENIQFAISQTKEQIGCCFRKPLPFVEPTAYATVCCFVPKRFLLRICLSGNQCCYVDKGSSIQKLLIHSRIHASEHFRNILPLCWCWCCPIYFQIHSVLGENCELWTHKMGLVAASRAAVWLNQMISSIIFKSVHR